MRLTLVSFFVGFFLLVVLLGALAPAARPDGDASPSPTPVVTPTGTPSPAPAWLVQRCLKQRARTVKAWRAWQHMKSCFGERGKLRVEQRPAHGSDAWAWRAVRDIWRQQERDIKGRMEKLLRRLRHPGGTGVARWFPTMRYAGWSESGIRTMAPIMAREAGGAQHRWNREGSRCFGLFQLHPCHWAKKGLKWIWDPINQCLMAWHLYHVVQHDSPYPAWAL